MSAEAEQFVIAVRRECREVVPADWRTRVTSIRCVRVVGSAKGSVIRVESTGEGDAKERLVEAVGEYCHIEPVVRFDTQGRSLKQRAGDR